MYWEVAEVDPGEQAWFNYVYCNSNSHLKGAIVQKSVQRKWGKSITSYARQMILFIMVKFYWRIYQWRSMSNFYQFVNDAVFEEVIMRHFSIEDTAN